MVSSCSIVAALLGLVSHLVKSLFCHFFQIQLLFLNASILGKSFSTVTWRVFVMRMEKVTSLYEKQMSNGLNEESRIADKG